MSKPRVLCDLPWKRPQDEVRLVFGGVEGSRSDDAVEESGFGELYLSRVSCNRARETSIQVTSKSESAPPRHPRISEPRQDYWLP